VLRARQMGLDVALTFHAAGGRIPGVRRQGGGAGSGGARSGQTRPPGVERAPRRPPSVSVLPPFA
jgi:hypothetical protein